MIFMYYCNFKKLLFTCTIVVYTEKNTCFIYYLLFIYLFIYLLMILLSL